MAILPITAPIIYILYTHKYIYSFPEQKTFDISILSAESEIKEDCLKSPSICQTFNNASLNYPKSILYLKIM